MVFETDWLLLDMSRYGEIMRLSDTRLDELLASSAPFKVNDEPMVRMAVIRTIDGFTDAPKRVKRPVLVASVLGGVLVVGTTAAALPSIFDDFGRIDYQSSQNYTVDGRGPFRCDFAFRVDPPVDGKVLEPSTADAPPYADILSFVQTHDWTFDDQPVALTTIPSEVMIGDPNPDRTVMANFISARWRSEVTSAYPNWMASVGQIDEAGQCAPIDGSAW
jgi:hypothetical protein